MSWPVLGNFCSLYYTVAQMQRNYLFRMRFIVISISRKTGGIRLSACSRHQFLLPRHSKREHEQSSLLELLIHLSPVPTVCLAPLISVGETFNSSDRLGPSDLHISYPLIGMSNFQISNINQNICNSIGFFSEISLRSILPNQNQRN